MKILRNTTLHALGTFLDVSPNQNIISYFPASQYHLWDPYIQQLKNSLVFENP